MAVMHSVFKISHPGAVCCQPHMFLSAGAVDASQCEVHHFTLPLLLHCVQSLMHVIEKPLYAHV
jgi:hypothetical protein